MSKEATLMALKNAMTRGGFITDKDEEFFGNILLVGRTADGDFIILAQNADDTQPRYFVTTFYDIGLDFAPVPHWEGDVYNRGLRHWAKHLIVNI